MKSKLLLLLIVALTTSCGASPSTVDAPTPIPDFPGERTSSRQILLFEGNDCIQDIVGWTDDSIPQIINFKQTSNFQNDGTRSMLLVNVQPEVVIRLYDNPDGEVDDDWVEILVKQAIPDYCIGSYEQSFENDFVSVTFHDHNGLDGKVSRLEVRNPSVALEISPTLTETEPAVETVTPPPPQTPTATFTPINPPFAQGMEKAIVVSIVDGDTIKVELDGVRKTLRYIGIDTPEVGQPYFEESDQANRSLIPTGSIVYLEKDVSETDPFDRILRYVYLPNETFVNGALVAMGMAFVKAYPPDTKHQEFLFSLEEQAKSDQVGMWATILYTPTPEPSAPIINLIVDRSCSQFDSPGNDNETKEEEYVCITNKGSASVIMNGWRIVDEAGHSYSFQNFNLGAGSSVKVRTGCGIDTTTDLYWCFGQSAIWNNGGDTASLYDDSSQLITELSY